MDRRELFQLIPLLGMSSVSAEQQMKDDKPVRPLENGPPIILAPCNGDTIPSITGNYVDVYGYKGTCNSPIIVYARNVNGIIIFPATSVNYDANGYWHIRIQLSDTIYPFSIFAFCSGGPSAIVSGLRYGASGPVIDPYFGIVKEIAANIPIMDKDVNGKHFINLKFNPIEGGKAEVVGMYWSKKKMKFKKMQIDNPNHEDIRKCTAETFDMGDFVLLKFITNNTNDDVASNKNSFTINAYTLHAIRIAK